MSVLSAVLMGIVLVFIKTVSLENDEMVLWFIFKLCDMSMAENKILLAAEEGCYLLFVSCCMYNVYGCDYQCCGCVY